MSKRSILHMLDPTPHNSPFDVNMALDAGFDILMPYNTVKIDDVRRLVQDTIFSRGPSGVKQTAMFIGGRDLGLAMDMLTTCKQAMVPPFAISVLADPSGAFTTAAALVACVSKQLSAQHNKTLKGCTVLVFGGTGPVGLATGIIASLAGADTALVDHLSIDTAEETAKEYNRRFGCTLRGAVAVNAAEKAKLIEAIDVIFCTTKAGIQVLSASVLQAAKQLKVVGDVNAVPPLGIEGIKTKDFGFPLATAVNSPGAVGVGALAVGDIKYQLQHALLKSMLDTDKPLYLDFRNAFALAETLL